LQADDICSYRITIMSSNRNNRPPFGERLFCVV
jgi:hypothetical protein